MAADPYLSNVSLLLYGQGTDGSTTFFDSSPAIRTVTPVGNARISTAQSKFGGSSMYFDGAGGYLTIPASADFAFGTGDFTIEFYYNSTQATVYATLISSKWASGSNWQIMNGADGNSICAWANAANSGAPIMTATNAAIHDGAWHHFAWVCAAGVHSLYFDGVSHATYTTAAAIGTETAPISIGRDETYGPRNYLGYLDELRVTKGVARYTANFTPPASFAPGSALASLTAPSAAVSATGGVASSHITAELWSPLVTARGYGGANAVLTAPSALAVGYGPASFGLTAPSPTFHASGHHSTGEQAANLTAPSPTLFITTGAHAKALTAPRPTVTATGTVTGWAKVAIKSPKPAISATATVSGMMSAAIRAPSPNLVGYGGAVCSVTLTGRPTVQATGTTGGVASVAVTCPLFQVTASATAQNYGSIHVIAPSPRMGNTMQAWITAPSARLTAIGTAVVTATYEAYAINLNHVPVRGVDPVDEVTRYTNFPFTHVVRYKNSYYGANSTGLYLLEGTTDDEAPIEFAVKTAMTDFDSPLRKTVVSAYFAGRLGSQTAIDLHVGEDGAKPYSHTTVRGEHAQNYRQKFGRGTDARYYAIGASGAGTIELDSIELMVQTSKRRI